MIALPNTVLASLAFREAARHPARSVERLAAAEVCGMTSHTLTLDEARQRLLGVSDPAVRDAALALLDKLAALSDAAAGAEQTA